MHSRTIKCIFKLFTDVKNTHSYTDISQKPTRITWHTVTACVIWQWLFWRLVLWSHAGISGCFFYCECQVSINLTSMPDLLTWCMHNHCGRFALDPQDGDRLYDCITVKRSFFTGRTETSSTKNSKSYCHVLFFLKIFNVILTWQTVSLFHTWDKTGAHLGSVNVTHRQSRRPDSMLNLRRQKAFLSRYLNEWPSSRYNSPSAVPCGERRLQLGLH